MQGESLDLGESLEAIEDAVLPHLSQLIDSLLDSAILARPGLDADLHASELRFTAQRLDSLGVLLASVASLAAEAPAASSAPAAQPAEAPRRMSA